MPNKPYQPTTAYKAPGNRYISLGIVVLLHLAAIYALVVVLDVNVVALIKGPLTVRTLSDEQAKEDVPPPPPPKFEAPPPAYVPAPDINVQSTAPTTTAIAAVRKEVAVAPPAPKVTVPASLDKKNTPEPDYPPISRRLGEEGSVVIAVRVGPEGQVLETKIEKSSGFNRLDAAAIAGAQRAKFKPGQVDGKPAETWTRYEYTFRLT